MIVWTLSIPNNYLFAFCRSLIVEANVISTAEWSHKLANISSE